MLKHTPHFVVRFIFCHPHSTRLRTWTVFFRLLLLQLVMTAFSRPELAEQDHVSRASLRKRARRLAIAAAIRRRQVVAAIQLLSGGQGPQGKKRRTESLFSWKDHVSRLTEREFKLRYRLDFDAFNKLVKIICRDITVTSEQQARLAKWPPLPRLSSSAAQLPPPHWPQTPPASPSQASPASSPSV